jgi:hypothetical protein
LADYEDFLRRDRAVLARLGTHDYHYQTNYDVSPLDILPTVRFSKRLWRALTRKVWDPIWGLDGVYDVHSEAFRVTVSILDSFYSRALDQGVLPIVVIFPDIKDLRRNRAHASCSYAPLLGHLRSRGYQFIDLMDALAPYESVYTLAQLTGKWGHYSPLGQRLIARHLHRWLSEGDLLDLSKIVRALHEARQRAAADGHSR